jgi:hypothetical protein
MWLSKNLNMILKNFYSCHQYIQCWLFFMNYLSGATGTFCRRLAKSTEELHNLYASPHIIRVIKPRRMRWAACIARMVKIKKCIQYFGWKT